MDDEFGLSALEPFTEEKSFVESASLSLGLEQEGSFRFCMKRTISTQTDFDKKPRKKRKQHIGTKVERCDKYWFRAFRSYIRETRPAELKQEMTKEKAFWLWYFSKEGKPETSSQYISYNRSFREHLLRSCSFQRLFREWMLTHGLEELKRKHGESPFGTILKKYGQNLVEIHEDQ